MSFNPRHKPFTMMSPREKVALAFEHPKDTSPEPEPDDSEASQNGGESGFNEEDEQTCSDVEAEVNIYNKFAEIYDVFGSEEFCLALATYLLDAAERYEIPPGSPCLDLACGTGVITLELARAGYSMLGIDRSPSMLQRARHRAQEAGKQIEFICADIRNFEVDEPFPWIISTHDSLDHLYLPEDLAAAFMQASKALLPGGLFMFDMNCWEGIRHLNGRTVFVETEHLSGAYHLIADDHTLETQIVGFIHRYDNLYERFAETLFQRCYSDQEIEGLLKECGLIVKEKFAVQHLEGDIFKQLWITQRPTPHTRDLLF